MAAIRMDKKTYNMILLHDFDLKYFAWGRVNLFARSTLICTNHYRNYAHRDKHNLSSRYNKPDKLNHKLTIQLIKE